MNDPGPGGVAMEDGEHGYFTRAILDGLKGKADASGDRQVSVLELALYVDTKVRVESEGTQIPTTRANFNSDVNLVGVEVAE